MNCAFDLVYCGKLVHADSTQIDAQILRRKICANLCESVVNIYNLIAHSGRSFRPKSAFASLSFLKLSFFGFHLSGRFNS